MPIDTYEGSSEQTRYGIVATHSVAPSPPVQLKMNPLLLQVELDQMQIE